jgi:GNAT superfamily N-acetyltransferase
MTPELEILASPSLDDREAILAPLRAYNEQAGGPANSRLLAIVIRDPDGGGIIGGLWGRSSYDWLFIELLVVPEQLRGQQVGTALMTEAERQARERGCVGIWLDTYGFQALGFYRKLGFQPVGEIPDHPRGSTRTFLAKRLVP